LLQLIKSRETEAAGHKAARVVGAEKLSTCEIFGRKTSKKETTWEI
jgi:hypothetical protein